MLLVEVERYARRVTLRKSGKLKQWLNQSQTYQYPMTEASTTTAFRVWKNLDKFNGQSKFSSWVYRIAQNTRKDIVEGVVKRGEMDFLEWKDYQSSYHCSQGAASESENGEYETRAGTRPLVVSLINKKIRVSPASIAVKDTSHNRRKALRGCHIPAFAAGAKP